MSWSHTYNIHREFSFWHHKRQNVHALIERKWRKQIENLIILKKFLVSVQLKKYSSTTNFAVVWNVLPLLYKSNDFIIYVLHVWLLLSKRRWTKKASFWPFTRCDVLVAGSLHSNAMNILWRRGTVKLSDDSMDGGEGKKKFLIAGENMLLLSFTQYMVRLLLPQSMYMYVLPKKGEIFTAWLWPHCHNYDVAGEYLSSLANVLGELWCVCDDVVLVPPLLFFDRCHIMDNLL